MQANRSDEWRSRRSQRAGDSIGDDDLIFDIAYPLGDANS
jgi:hypothetical protein